MTRLSGMMAEPRLIVVSHQYVRYSIFQVSPCKTKRKSLMQIKLDRLRPHVDIDFPLKNHEVRK